MKLKHIKLSSTERLYKIENPIVSISGGIATGKSTVVSILKEMGFFFISADELVKDIYGLQETKHFIKSLVPDSIKDNVIDFKILRESFFKDNKIKQEVESWIYPRLELAFKKKLSETSPQDVVFYEIPLLYERKMQHLFDLNVLVFASHETQIKRVMQRDNVNRDSAIRVLDAQISIEEKRKLAEVIIENNEDEEKLREEVKNFISQYFI